MFTCKLYSKWCKKSRVYPPLFCSQLFPKRVNFLKNSPNIDPFPWIPQCIQGKSWLFESTRKKVDSVGTTAVSHIGFMNSGSGRTTHPTNRKQEIQIGDMQNRFWLVRDRQKCRSEAASRGNWTPAGNRLQLVNVELPNVELPYFELLNIESYRTLNWLAWTGHWPWHAHGHSPCYVHVTVNVRLYVHVNMYVQLFFKKKNIVHHEQFTTFLFYI
jgi:hypothetical protein